MMAIKATLPPVLVTQVINVKMFKEIRDTLILLVENPVIRESYSPRGQVKKGLPHSAKCSGNQKMMLECVIQRPDNCEKKEHGRLQNL